MCELDLLFIDNDTVWVTGEVLVVVVGVRLVPMTDSGSASADSEPPAEIMTLRY